MNEIATCSPSALSNSQLYRLCQLYGGNAKSWLRKFAGLLPEVYKRQLYRKHGCASIHEFAKKLASMNEATVDKILNLYRKLQGKPTLLSLLESGEQGWSKLEAVAYIATTETDKEFARKVVDLPKEALVKYVQSKRENFTAGGETQNIFQSMQTPGFTFSFPISQKSREKLNFIKNQLEKDYKKTLTWDEVIKFWPLKTQKTIIQKICPNCATGASKKTEVSRHIPAAIKKLTLSRHGEKCAYPNCTQPYHELHHAKAYAMYKKHDPENIFPLCKTHHLLSHAGLIANQHLKPEHWYIRDKAIQSEIDKKVMYHHDARSFFK